MAEGHGAQANLRNFQACITEPVDAHGDGPSSRITTIVSGAASARRWSRRTGGLTPRRSSAPRHEVNSIGIFSICWLTLRPGSRTFGVVTKCERRCAMSETAKVVEQLQKVRDFHGKIVEMH